MSRRVHPPLLLVLAAVLALSGCMSLEGLRFTVDDRVEITSPESRSTVQVPLTVSWTYRNFELAGSGRWTDRGVGSFAVFVDRAPMPPDKDMRWLFRKDRACLADDECPTESYLAERQVFLTDEPELTLEQLPRPERPDDREEHTITIVLLDGSGYRIGESAWYVDVFLDRGDG